MYKSSHTKHKLVLLAGKQHSMNIPRHPRGPCSRQSPPPPPPLATASGGRSRQTPAASLRTDTSLALVSRAASRASSAAPPTSHFSSGVAGPLRRPPPGAPVGALTGRRLRRRGVRRDGAAAGATHEAAAERFLELISGCGSGRPASAAASGGEQSTAGGCAEPPSAGDARRTRSCVGTQAGQRGGHREQQPLCLLPHVPLNPSSPP